MAPTKTNAMPKSAAETAMPRQEGMTHSDSMPIVTPGTGGRVRKLSAAAPIPTLTATREEVSPQGKRRRWVLLAIFLLLLAFGLWIGRIFYRGHAVPVDIQSPTPAPVTAALVAPTIPAHTEAAKPAATTATVVAAAPPAVTVADAAPVVPEAPPTHLLEVSVGTSVRGGLTMKFDHPVSWSVLGNDGHGSAEVAVLGVRDLGTFPRNLPLPPGVKVIHAGIIEPDTLRLVFTLVPGVRALTTPADGPAAVLNIFFRTAREMAALAALPQSLQTTGGCGVAATPRTAKAMQLLQASLDKNPSYAAVRTVLAMLATCGGDGARAERLLAGATQGTGDPALQLVAASAALRFARGDADGAVQMLKSSAGIAKADPGYAALLADLQSAAK
jgi:hypothetical protein